MHTRPTYDELLEKVNRLEQDLTRLKNKPAAVNPDASPPHGDEKSQLNQLKDIIDNAPLIIDSFSAEGRCVLWNKKGEETLGWTQNDMLNAREPLALCYPDPRIRKEVHTAISNADGQFREYRLTAKDGSIRIQEWANFKLKDDSAIAFGMDITEKRKTEEDLRNSHDFIQVLLHTIPNPVFYKDALGRYTGCNKAFEDFTGMSRDTIMGKTVFEIAPQELAKKYHDKDRPLLETPGRQQYEWRVLNHCGEEKDVIFDKASILDSHGGINGLVGIISDISERKSIERALKKSEARFRAFIEAIPDILFIFDEDGKYIEIFTSASELLFDDLQQLKGNYIQNVLPADVAKQHTDVIKKTIETQKIQFFEYTLSVPKGDCWFESFTAPILDIDEKKRFIASSVRDVTSRKLAEKEISEKQKLATVMETAGAVCHELNQPLQIISGCCELLQDEPDLSPELQRKIEIIVNATERMAKLNHSLMNITSYKTKSYLKSKIIDIKGSAESDA